MKLLTASGLLYSAVSAATADGHNGAFTQIDWAVTLAEQGSSVTNLSTQAGAPAIGWDPMVSHVSAAWDGGKVLAGHGKLSGTILSGWVVKMFGASGTMPCGNDSKVTGYAALSYSINSAVATTSECLTETQWTWATLTDTKSTVILGVVEEYIVGGGTANVGADPWYYCVGGTSAYATFGLGNWWAYVNALTFDGLDVASQTLNGAHEEKLHRNGGVLSTDVGQSQKQATSGCYTAVDMQYLAQAAAVAGLTGSSSGCDDFAMDGFLLTGTAVAYELPTKVFTITLTAPLPAGSFTLPSATTVAIDSQADGGNAGSITQIIMDPTTDDGLLLLTSGEFYADSFLVGMATTAWATQDINTLAKADYGSTRYVYCISAAQTADTNLVTTAWTVCVFVGHEGGQGRMGTGGISGHAFTLNTSVLTDSTYTVSTGIGKFDPPTGGVAQFKGLAAGTTEKTYVAMICHGVAPLFYTTAWHTFSAGASNGWMVTCMTGIAQCDVSLADQTTALTTAVRAICLADPRYNTWRMVTHRITYAGAQTWYRTDSYWNSASSVASSTWGPGISLSASYSSADDNNGATNVGKTFVFAYADGSGVQLNHLTYATVAPTGNTTAGTGTNALTTAPTAFYNTSPNLYTQNKCAATNLLLEGTTDTSGLASTVTAYSDGYKATVSVGLEMQLNGAIGGWSGVCMVLYSSQYVQDNTNGAVCVAAMQNSAAGSGPTDFGAAYLMHVPASTWTPPSMTGSVTPSSLALSDAKYGVVYSPTAATAYLFTEGFYASAVWYQPSYASSYTLVARYGKDNYVGAYCMSGAGSTSYFAAGAGGVLLTGAATLAASVLAVGSALSLAM